MKILVAYASTYGSTAGIADRIAATLTDAGLDAAARPVTDGAELGPYDAFVVGSAVFAGRWTDEALEFVRRNADILSDRPTWLFSSGPVGNTATRYVPSDPEDVAALRRAIHPLGHKIFAGAWDRANAELAPRRFVERFVARHFIPEGDWRDWGEVDRWAQGIASQLSPVAARR